MGRLTRDAELKYLPSGNAILTGSFACNERRKAGDDWIDEPCFINIVLFGKLGEALADKMGKGDPLLIEGRLKYRQWEQDGQKRSKHEIVVDKVRLLNKPSKSEAVDTHSEYDDSELPF